MQNKQFRTFFLKHSLTAILDAEHKRLHIGFFELKMLRELVRESFFIKIIIGTWSYQ